MIKHAELERIKRTLLFIDVNRKTVCIIDFE